MIATAPVTPIASKAHTAILASAFLLFAIAGGYAQRTGRVQGAAPNEQQAIQLYVSALIVEWASVLYVWKGTRRNVPLGSLVGGRWQSPMAIATDVAIAATSWSIWMGVVLALPAPIPSNRCCHIRRSNLRSGCW